MLTYLLSFTNKEWHHSIFTYVSYLSIILIIATYTGLLFIDPRYINSLHNLLIYYVCFILLVRFNPVVKHDHEAFDRKISFSAGIILLTTIISKQVADHITSK